MTELTTDELRAIFTGAAELVEKGWCQHTGFVPADLSDNGNDQHCATYALTSTYGDLVAADSVELPNYEQHADQMLDALYAVGEVSKPENADARDHFDPLVCWNDCGERTQEDVVKLLRRVAEQI